MKQLIKRLVFMFVVIGLMYMGMEVLHHGHSHWSMGIVAGICSLIAYYIHFKRPDIHMLQKAVLIACIITLFEYIAGVIFNGNYQLWDYRNMTVLGLPSHIKGYICVQFWLIWVLVTPFMLFMVDKLKDETIDIADYYKALFKVR